MKKFLFSILILFFVCSRAFSAGLTPPESFFGFKPGAEGRMFDYGELISYLEQLDEKSPRLKMARIGESPLGRDMYIAFISTADNIQSLDELVEINRALALRNDLSEEQLRDMIGRGKVFFAATLSMHSNEVGPSQAAPEIAYTLVSGESPEANRWLGDVVYMMVPCHNPDGMDMVVKHYRKYAGTKYEGSRMPGVYHKYVGHDNNRDFLALTQSDTRAVSFIFSRDWFPQVMVEKHQMGSSGVRYFVPPNHDPIAVNIDAGIWNWSGIFGANMMKDMTAQEQAGVSQHYLFDDYWPGSTETCIWKNVIGFLTECASAQYARPVYVEPGELSVIGKGLSEYEKSINMPMPWKGGWWKLSDIVDYEIVSTLSVIKTCSLHREDILAFRNELCVREVERGKGHYFILPAEQHDRTAFAGLVNLMLDHGAEVWRLDSERVIEGRVYGEGSIVIPLAQPFRPFIKEVLERQDYPERHYTPGGEMIKPYEITSWSFPLCRGVDCVELKTEPAGLAGAVSEVSPPFNLLDGSGDKYGRVILPASDNGSYRAAFRALELGLDVWRLNRRFDERAGKGSFYIDLSGAGGEDAEAVVSGLDAEPVTVDSEPELEKYSLEMPEIGLVETWFHDMDAGWTRYVFDSYNIPYRVIRPADISDTDLEDDFDLLVFADRNSSVFLSGKYKGRRYGREYLPGYPPEYRKGMGKEGQRKLLKFIDEGGRVVSWGGSVGLFEGILTIEEEGEEFQLPFNDISEDLKKKGLYVAGTTIRVRIREDHPITWGMQSEIGILYSGGPVFSTSIPRFDMDRKVIVSFAPDDLVMSGYGEKVELLEKKSAALWMKKGEGDLILFGFRPQFRAQTEVTFKLLFNSILLP
ncbi:MAG: M14 family metallopeptidase [Candidatus Krumholzibacteriales bacterium]